MKVKVIKIGNRILCRKAANFEKVKLFLYGFFLGFLFAMILYSVIR